MRHRGAHGDNLRHRTGADRSAERLPQRDGATWELVGDSVESNGTLEHIEQLLQAAKSSGHVVFISPHYYYPTDHEGQFGGTLENMMHEIDMFARSGPLDLAADVVTTDAVTTLKG